MELGLGNIGNYKDLIRMVVAVVRNGKMVVEPQRLVAVLLLAPNVVVALVPNRIWG